MENGAYAIYDILARFIFVAATNSTSITDSQLRTKNWAKFIVSFCVLLESQKKFQRRDH